MKEKPIPEAKRRHIAGKHLEDFMAFFHQLSTGEQQRLRDELPVPDGFRPEGKRSDEARLRQLLSDLKGKGESARTSRAWDRYTNSMFHRWLQSHPSFNDLLSTFDNDPDFAEQKDGILPNSELDVACFGMLAKACQAGVVTPDQIKAFYEFGYFLLDKRIEYHIELAMLLFQLRELSVRVDALDQQHERQAKALHTMAEDVESSKKGVQDQLTQLRQMHAMKADLQTLKSIEDSTVTLSSRLDALAETDEHLSAQLSNAAPQSKVNNLATELDALIRRVDELVQPVTGFTQTLEAIQLRLNEQEIAILRAMEMRLDAAIKVMAIAHPTPGEATSTLLLDRLPAATARTWDGERPLAAILSNNLRSIGLIPESARGLSQEILAGLHAGQLVTFKGSLASNIATLCAKTFACENISVLRLPLGLLSGLEFSTQLEAAIGEAEKYETLSVLLIEGLNRSAIEVYGERLRVLVSERMLQPGIGASKLLLLGTLVEGPAALPPSPTLCEVGPILDVDAQSWSMKQETRTLQMHSVPHAAWNTHLPVSADTVLRDLDEVYEVFQGTSILWRRCARAAYRRLTAQALSGDQPSALQSLAFGWLIPYAQAWGSTSDQIRDRLLPRADIVVEGDQVKDQRVARLLGVFCVVETDE